MAQLNVTWCSGRTPLGAVLVGALGSFLLGGCGASDGPPAGQQVSRLEAAAAHPGSETADSEIRGHNPNPALFPLRSQPYGSSMATWAENWWKWELSIPAAQNPLFSLTADCSVNQDGPVFFVPPVPLGSKNVTRSCTVEHGKAVAISLSTVLNDYPCPDPTFQPAPGQSLFDFLLAGAVAGNADIAEIDVTFDGESLKNMLAYHFASDDLTFFKGDLSLQSTLDSCITGGLQPAAVDAFFILFKPLSPGHHTITRTVVTTRGTVTGPNTTELEVLDEH